MPRYGLRRLGCDNSRRVGVSAGYSTVQKRGRMQQRHIAWQNTVKQRLQHCLRPFLSSFFLLNGLTTQQRCN
jgi:hypothetical protein